MTQSIGTSWKDSNTLVLGPDHPRTPVFLLINVVVPSNSSGHVWDGEGCGTRGSLVFKTRDQLS